MTCYRQLRVFSSICHLLALMVSVSVGSYVVPSMVCTLRLTMWWARKVVMITEGEGAAVVPGEYTSRCRCL